MTTKDISINNSGITPSDAHTHHNHIHSSPGGHHHLSDNESGSSSVGINLDLDNDSLLNKGFKNFRHSPDIENFYRFVHEHDLRREAKMILDRIMAYIAKTKKKKKSKPLS